MEISKEHIIPYLEGHLSGEENAFFEEKMRTSGSFRKDVEAVRAILEKTVQIKQWKEVRTLENWNALSRRIERLQWMRTIWNVSRNVAATLLLPLLAAGYFYFHFQQEQTDERVEITSAQGLLSKITLPDGSSVWLNSGSTISYPKTFGSDSRQVQLNGEAYFKVTADPAHRFDVVVPDRMTVSAYGTEFNVCAYENDNRVEVFLAKGHVTVSGRHTAEKDLNVSQLASLDKNRPEDGIQVTEANINEKTSWKDGKMVFRRTGFTEVVKRLSRHFNVEITVQNPSIYEYEYSATFTTETLPEILSLLEKSAPINCRLIEPDKQEDLSYGKRKVIISTRKRTTDKK
jgi:ferric-dicitrate binding protein FerR (iron transport regulator)